jgi:hypothetical protein
MIYNYDHFPRWNVKSEKKLYTFKKFIKIQQRLTQNILCIVKIINIFSNMLQKISLKNSPLWKNQNDHIRTIILRSFIIVSLFACDLIQQVKDYMLHP